MFKAYESPFKLYNEPRLSYFNALGSSLKSNSGIILNFEQFVSRLLPALEAAGRKTPFTFPAYVKSTYCPMSVSGLVIEIADLKPTNDEEKIKFFYNSLNWEFFLNACREYGFMVDQLIPWRIVADIGSPMMMQYAKSYGLNSTDTILKSTYTGAHLSYFRNFKNYMLSLYNTSIEPMVYESAMCPNGGTLVKRRRPMKYTIDTLNNKYGDL